MPTKYVSVTFSKQKRTDVIAQVNTDLSGVELEDKIAIPHEWMEDFFGEEWDEWEIDGITVITDDWSIIKDRSTNSEWDRQLSEAPLFEIANNEEQV